MDVVQEARLDEALNSPVQQSIAQGVKRLSSETPSMAWRSQLNERLLAEAAKKRAERRRRALVWRPVAGLAVASALTMAILIPNRNLAGPSGRSVEADVWSAHSVAEKNFYLTGTTGVARETDSNALANASYDWEAADLTAL